MAEPVSGTEPSPAPAGRDAATALMQHVYADLRALAAHYLRAERPGHTLQPTALVHEVYLKLADKDRVQWRGRSHFIAVAATLMRRILVDHARGAGAAKRGGGARRVSLDSGILDATGPGVDLVALDRALEKLARLDERQARVVELRFFGGLSVEQAAEVLDVSPRCVEADWAMARAFLARELMGGAPP